METIQLPSSASKGIEPVIMVIDFFDGFHIGHQHLLEEVKSVTHERERLAVLSIERQSKYGEALTSLKDKEKLFIERGVDRYYYIEVDEKEDMPLQDLITKHLQLFKIKQIYISESFNPSEGGEFSMEKWGKRLHAPIKALPTVTLQGKEVDSESIKPLVKQGRMEAVQAMLGRPYEVSGVVEKGEQLGRKLGFPTLNLGGIDEYIQVKPGVYLGTVEISSGSWYYTLISAGYRPTVQGDSYKVEAYLLDFSGDVYNQEVTVKFLRHLRDEVNFDGMEDLVDQMKQDEHQARTLLGL
ncbi:riboflavin biosynthesis protein RibF [Halobacillus salinarum]|uniref:Riboflavin biosynthesis protein n=1 Tax=Halobacillus salinarum TaxID=2932257 RepID=A0ABY4EJA9_9BACI|nr:riboflavin kinase [Halobacillus salinarum]UOQ44520.1 riboflavin biosynthesis protein RibF [Halobacillus salinarum]